MQREHGSGNARWTHFATLKFQSVVDEDTATQMLWDWFKHLARNIAREHVPVVYAVERGTFGRVHLHALLAVPPHAVLNRDDARYGWHHLHRFTGFERFVRYAEDRGGPWFVVKTDQWDFGVARPRRFARCRPRCAEDPQPR